MNIIKPIEFYLPVSYEISQYHAICTHRNTQLYVVSVNVPV